MKALATSLALLVVALGLAGCESDGASHLINGNTQALSVVRQKSHPWAAWQLHLVVRNDPVCQRRHRMKDVKGNTQVDLYSPGAGAYILRQGEDWYVTELQSCGFEQYKRPPAVPGDLIGSFAVRNQQYSFEAAPGAGKARTKSGDGS
jgi:hypothetical protein